MRVTVTFYPQSETELIIMKPHWAADNGHETAVFVSKDAAIKFARQRWGISEDQIEVIGSA